MANNIETGEQAQPLQTQTEQFSRRQFLQRGAIRGLEVVGVAAGLAAIPSILGRGDVARAGTAVDLDPDTEMELNAEWVDPIRIESAQQAADMFGGKPNRWEINEFGGAHYLGRTDGKTTRLRTNGAVVEGWIAIRRNGEHQAQTLVANPLAVKILDIQQGTWWKARKGEENELTRQVRRAVIDRESKPPEQGGQPDVAILPLCIPGPETHRFVTPKKLTKKQVIEYVDPDANDPWIQNSNNWRKAGTGWTLVPDPSGLHHRVRAGNGVWRAWIAIDRPKGIDALAIVATQVKGVDIRGGTFYMPKPGDQKALFNQVLGQVEADEAKTQRGVLVIPVCN